MNFQIDLPCSPPVELYNSYSQISPVMSTVKTSLRILLKACFLILAIFRDNRKTPQSFPHYHLLIRQPNDCLLILFAEKKAGEC